MRIAALVIAVIFVPATASFAQQAMLPKGVIRGNVCDERNQPVAGAEVTLDPDDDHAGQRALPGGETDSHGNFVIDHLMWGKYLVFVGKEDAGYPNTRFEIYSGRQHPVAEISPDHPEASVALKLGPKAGILTVIVLDASTGQPIDSSLLGGSIWKWSDEDNLFVSGTIVHNNKILIPPYVAVGIAIGAKGYESERYPEKILLPLGGETTIELKLQPTPKKP